MESMFAEWYSRNLSKKLNAAQKTRMKKGTVVTDLDMCPLIDRVDVQIEVDAVPYDDLTGKSEEEPSADIKNRVEAARVLQRERFADDNIFFNAQMDARAINRYCTINAEASAFMKSVYTQLKLSARAHSRAQ